MADKKVVILCGGRGTRINEETVRIPKPLIKIDDKPILWHIMKIYSYYGYNKFVLCLGYKGSMIEDYFSKIDTWDIDFVNTGIETGTAGRISQIRDYVGSRFFMTYGDGLSNVNIEKLEQFHVQNGGIATVTAVRPLVRFGMLDVTGNKVNSFRKYSQPSQGWIDGGFFVFEKSLFSYLNNIDDKEMLEGNTLESIANDNQLFAYKHDGYWKCIDTYRDLIDVRNDIKTSNDKWRIWN